MTIFLYFVLALGFFEVVSNLYHLSKGSISKIGESAKKQHREISTELSSKHFFVKVILMFSFGLFQITASLAYLFNLESGWFLLFYACITFGSYGILQALFYRKPYSVWSSAFVYNIPVIVLLLLK